jgi:hypothetical protein
MAKLRNLDARRPVPGAVLSRDALLAKLKTFVDRTVPPDAIRHEGDGLKLFGYLPESLDYLSVMYALLREQLAGFYDQEDGTMYMGTDPDEESAEATLAHELVHALQDQHFDMKSHSTYEPGKSDEQEAYSALAEGDATSAMFDELLKKGGKSALDIPNEDVQEQMIEGIDAADKTAPHVLKMSLVAPYVYGSVFVNTLRRSGGWAAVDEAWRTLPTTTEQILHVEKWRAHEPALAVPAPSFAALGGGWTAVDEDTDGELGLRIGFAEWVGGERGAAAANGWGGDRDTLLEKGTLRASATHVRYDADRAADPKAAPFALLAAGLPKSVGKLTVKEAHWLCILRPELGPLGVMEKGRDLVLVAGPAQTSGDAGAKWSSAGDCALAKAWAKEIAAQ